MVAVGDAVLVNHLNAGVVRFVGSLAGKGDVFVGVELSKPRKSSGAFRVKLLTSAATQLPPRSNRRPRRCTSKHPIFMECSSLVIVSNCMTGNKKYVQAFVAGLEL